MEKINWILSKQQREYSTHNEYKLNNYYFYINNKVQFTANSNANVFIDGFVLPRVSDDFNSSDSNSNRIVEDYYNIYGDQFTSKIKGNFIILIIKNDGFQIYTDRIGVKKVFYYENESDFIISNDIFNITSKVEINVSPENIAVKSLMHHFIDGKTSFKYINFFKPASLIKYNGFLSKSVYWKLDELLNLKVKKINYEHFADKMEQLVRSYLQFYKPQKVAISLTGGMDSRLIFSILLKLNVKLIVYTYGNPKSKDVIIAKEIASDFNLKFINPFEENPSESWFRELAEEIIISGNTISQVFRANRLDAIKKIIEIEKIDLVFGGYLGGEGIRGLAYNNYYSTNINKRIWVDREKMKEVVIDNLNQYFIKSNQVDEIVNVLQNQKMFISDGIRKKQFYFNYEMIAQLHHAVDINLILDYVPVCVSPYLDIDYLELLFSHNFNLLHYKNDKTKNLIYPKFYCKLIDKFYPDLTKYKFSNGFSPKDYLNGLITYIWAKYKHVKKKKTIVSNFEYKAWMGDFIIESTKDLSKEITDLFDVERMIRDITMTKTSSKEGYWHKYLNVIVTDMVIKKAKRFL